MKDPGGHSALPRRDNPIYRLAQSLGRLGKFDFPVGLNAVTRAYFERVAATEAPPMAAALAALLAGRTDAETLAPLAANVPYNAQIRTTCVATMLDAGHAENALPQTARATVNCRILPDQPVVQVGETLVRVIDDPKIAVIPVGKPVLSPPSPINPEVMQAVEKISAELWPGVPVIPTMGGGYTDSRWLRNAGMAAYGVASGFSETGKNGVHGLNEQVGVKQLYDGKEYLYRLVGPGASRRRRISVLTPAFVSIIPGREGAEGRGSRTRNPVTQAVITDSGCFRRCGAPGMDTDRDDPLVPWH